jgi:hypothetical protein
MRVDEIDFIPFSSERRWLSHCGLQRAEAYTQGLPPTTRRDRGATSRSEIVSVPRCGLCYLYLAVPRLGAGRRLRPAPSTDYIDAGNPPEFVGQALTESSM